jgi:hypothetical protein
MVVPLMLVAVATPKAGVVNDIFVAVVPLGSARIPPVALTVIVALPLEEPSKIKEDTAGLDVKPGTAADPVAFPNTV